MIWFAGCIGGGTEPEDCHQIKLKMAASISLLFLVISIVGIRASGATEVWIDCHPDSGATEQRCKDRGCTWKQKSIPDAPWCQFSNSDDPSKMAGYDALSTTTGYPRIGVGRNDIFTAKLQRRQTPTLFGADYQKATVKVERVTNEIVKVLIVDQRETAKRARVPEWKENLLRSGFPVENDEALLDVRGEKSPFGFAVVRRSTGVPLVDSRRLPGFTFAQQYIQVSTRVPTQDVYGLGETTHEHLRHDFNYKSWGLFTRDNGPGQSNINLYGVHPFYLSIDDDSGNAHGVFFLNTHALNVALQPDPDNPKGGIITWRAIGGAIEFFVLAGPTPDDVIRQYTSLIGRPQMPPYWSLGFQLSRYGYSNLTFLNDIFQRNRRANIPQDTQVIDIDYMYQYLDFTTDPVAFSNLTGFIRSLHDRYDMKLVLIVDPAIASRPPMAYEPLNQGLRSQVFIRDNRTGQPLEGKVWPGFTYFPDFTNPQTTQWWSSVIKDFHETQGIKFDGLWIDMNEPSNFVGGSTNGCAKNQYNQPPYVPLIYADINDKTLCMDADQYAGKHYEYHNLYGYGESRATYKALQALFPQKRPFVLSRSTFAGSGKFTNHWLGDNQSLWRHLRLSIIGMLEFNMFGIPMVGADICGFGGESTEELCTRWSQTGAFYPFSRNHNDEGSKREQDPAAWSPNATDIIRDALSLRYGLLPYLYTLLYHAHVNGTAVARALFFDFANDANAKILDDQFLWGSGLMVAPILDQGLTNRSVYFPKGRWYDLVAHAEVPGANAGRSLNISLPISAIGLYIRGGAILPWQNPGVNTVQSRRNAFGLLVGLDENSRACGGLYWDDGETLESSNTYLRFEAWNQGGQGGVHIKLIRNDEPIDRKLDTALIYGVPTKPTEVTVDGKSISEQSIVYDTNTKALRLDKLAIKLDRNREIAWKF